jgi:AraC family transcriptional regulator
VSVAEQQQQTNHLLADTPLVRVFDVNCRAPRSGYGFAEYNSVAQIGLVRRGVFVLERHKKADVIDTTTAVVLGAGDEYRIAHPGNNGDDGTVLILPPELIEEATGELRGRLARLRPRDHLAVAMVTRVLRDSTADDLEAEDAVFVLLAGLSHAFSTHLVTSRLGPVQRQRIEEARALLASAPTKRWTLHTLAQALRSSPFHLARQFRAARGETISHYLLRLRLALAVERLAEGERNLAMLAVDTGFAHHSHFTARFRGTFGMTPKEARDMITNRKLDDLRLLVGS